MNMQNVNPNYQLGAVEVLAETTYTTSANGTAFSLGKGRYDFVFTAADFGVSSAGGAAIVDIVANTAAATSTWKSVGAAVLVGSDAGGGGVVAGDNDYRVGVVNADGDHQMRIDVYMVGNANDLDLSCKAYSLGSKSI